VIAKKAEPGTFSLVRLTGNLLVARDMEDSRDKNEEKDNNVEKNDNEEKERMETKEDGGDMEVHGGEVIPDRELWQEVFAATKKKLHLFQPSKSHTAVMPDGDSQDGSQKTAVKIADKLQQQATNVDAESNSRVSSVASVHSQGTVGTRKDKGRDTTNFIRHISPPAAAAEYSSGLTDLEGLPSAHHSGPQALSLSRQTYHQVDPLALKGAWRVAHNNAYRLNRSGGDVEQELNEGDISAIDDVRAGTHNGYRDGAEEAIVLWTEGDLVEDPALVEGKVDRPQRRIFVGLGMVVVLILVISVSVGVTVSKRAAAPQASAGPTPSPTLAPTFEAFKITPAKVNEWLNSTKLSNVTILAMNQTGTPQNRAYQWLTSADHLPIPDDVDPLHRMTQQFALATLYYATGGDNATGWSNQGEWLVGADECGWLGCSCKRGQGSWVLQSLTLRANGLAGPLPVELSLLNRAEILDLSENDLYGSIPADLGTIVSLQSVSLSNNSFTGTIESELFQLTGLSSLKLEYNQLTGTIASEIGQLTKLTALEIWTNEDLTGSLPTEFGRLTGLTRLWMISSKFSGPRLSGPIPAELGNLTSLTSMIMSGYQFSGTIPSDLANLSLLDEINLSRNELTGTIPSELGRLSKLGQLEVSYNTGLMGEIPSEVCTLMNQNTLTVTISCDDADLTCACDCDCG
jgi:hypothetical protein